MHYSKSPPYSLRQKRSAGIDFCANSSFSEDSESLRRPRYRHAQSRPHYYDRSWRDILSQRPRFGGVSLCSRGRWRDISAQESSMARRITLGKCVSRSVPSRCGLAGMCTCFG
ncbi:hypothetical protein CB0940_11299 [Cercospora beticola]|uniref:Uncharacterized protein n=1 Tax=Cercospora beticola TaxID=122368 RepID=A0A2G5HDG8_CERBT|nr:hypothetical protein CB0940_11299 [Cercospora beticola]PIA90581.1 hypothetical protein CB0940_11299 [Cercospora beticola]